LKQFRQDGCVSFALEIDTQIKNRAARNTPCEFAPQINKEAVTTIDFIAFFMFPLQIHRFLHVPNASINVLPLYRLKPAALAL
jgi:hypothetical protein